MRKVSHHVQARLTWRLCSNVVFPIFWLPCIRADVDAYRIRYLSKLLCGQDMSLILKAVGYESSFLVYGMMCSSTMYNGSRNANINQMCPGNHIFNDNIIVLRSTKRRFSKLWIMKIRDRRRELKPFTELL